MAKTYGASDMPPTPADAQMTNKHAAQSVTYNMAHFTDHAKGAMSSLDRVKMVNPKKARALANGVVNRLDSLKGKVATMAKGYK